jgi:hypothetical protein
MGLFDDMSLGDDSSRDFEKVRRVVLMRLKEREIRQILMSVPVTVWQKASLFGGLSVEGKSVYS